MTDLIDRADSGEIPPIDDLGVKPIRDLSDRLHRRDTTDECTRNLAHEIAGLPPRRRPTASQTVDFTLVDAPLGLAGDNFGRPHWDIEPVDTLVFGVVYHAAATVDGELRPAAPGPLPTPLPPTPPPAPQPKPGYAGRHRLTFGRRVRRLLAGMGIIGAALVAIWAGLTVAALAVVL